MMRFPSLHNPRIIVEIVKRYNSSPKIYYSQLDSKWHIEFNVIVCSYRKRVEVSDNTFLPDFARKYIAVKTKVYSVLHSCTEMAQDLGYSKDLLCRTSNYNCPSALIGELVGPLLFVYVKHEADPGRNRSVSPKNWGEYLRKCLAHYREGPL